MNYLAHSFLSFTDGQIVGNMIADFIKNNEKENFPLEIQRGIRLHREIDSFTDSHPNVHLAKKVFSPLVRLYAGAFVDVSFDFFVAHQLSSEELKNHSQKVYRVLWQHEEFLPEQFKKMLVRMEQDDWLYNYREDWGIKFSLQNVLNKAKYLEKDLPVYEAYLDNKPILATEFESFFPDIKTYLKQVDLTRPF